MGSLKANIFIVYLPFLIVILSLVLPIKTKPYNILMPQSVGELENLNVQSIQKTKHPIFEPKEIFLLNKDNLLKNSQSLYFNMPKLTIIAKDKSGYFCFLDGRIYRQGQQGDGFRVLKIGSDYVVLQTPIGRQTLYVKIP